MVDSKIQDELIKRLDDRPVVMQRRVLKYAHSLSTVSSGCSLDGFNR